VRQLIKDIFDLLFPRTCSGCNNLLTSGEYLVCTECLYKLPRTGYWKEDDNPVAKKFWGRIVVENASSFLHFQKGGRLQNIIHQMKYRNKKEIGFIFGKLFGHELKDTKYAKVELIVPVPLHFSKFRKRGYNQSEWIAIGISEVLGVPINAYALERNIASESQTKKVRYDRWTNVMNVFSISNPDALKNKHILLVDDVLTTGATLEACANSILSVPNTKISIVTLADTLI
jgi:ComF family protein